MKDKFINASNKEKIIVHIVMSLLCICLTVLIVIKFDLTVAMLLGISLVIELLFIYLHLFKCVRFIKKEKHNNKIVNVVSEEEPLITKKDLIFNVNNKGKYINFRRIEAFATLDELITVDGKEYILNNKYSENLCFVENIDCVNLLDNVLFKHDPDNAFDKDTIVAYVGTNKIGLLFKGSCRDMLCESVKYNKYLVKSFVYYKSVKQNRIGIKIGYYSLVNDSNVIITSLIKTNKIDRLTDEKRSKSIFELENNEKVILEHHYGNDRIMVYSQSGFELGELDDKASKNILEKCESLQGVYASISKNSSNILVKVYIK